MARCGAFPGIASEVRYRARVRLTTDTVCGMGGVYAPANGEFSTGTFEMPTEPLWLDAEVKWQGGNHVGVPEGSDEGHQAPVCSLILHLTLLKRARKPWS